MPHCGLDWVVPTSLEPLLCLTTSRSSNPGERAVRVGRSSNVVWFMVADPSQWTWKALFLTKGSTSPSVASGALIPSKCAGDLVVGYESSPTLRIAALARITSEYDPDDPPEKAISVEPVSEVADGLTWVELKADPVFS